METELDYSYDLEVDFNSADPFTEPNKTTDSSIPDDLGFEDNIEKSDATQSISKDDLISPLGDSNFDEVLGNHQQKSPSNSKLDEEFYIGKLDSDGKNAPTRDQTTFSDVSSDEENEGGGGSSSRNRSKEGSSNGRTNERANSRKRKSSLSDGLNIDHNTSAEAKLKQAQSPPASTESERIRTTLERSSHQSHFHANSETEAVHVNQEVMTGGECGGNPSSLAAGVVGAAAAAVEPMSEDAEREMWLKELFKGARFYMIKSRNDHNVQLAKAKNVWSTTPANEPRLNKAFKSSRNVILLFSVTESQRFAGFARLASESDASAPMPPWQLPPGMSIRALSGVFQLDWITKEELLFANTTHLYNEWNLRKPVKIGRDGQEIEPSCGEKLCRLFEFSPTIDIYVIVKKVRAHEKARTTRDTTEPPEPHYYGGRGGYEGRGGGGFRGGYRPYRGYRGGYRGGYYGDRYDHHEDYYSSRDRRERSRSPPRGSTSSRSRGFNNEYFSTRGSGSSSRQDYERRHSRERSSERHRNEESSSSRRRGEDRGGDESRGRGSSPYGDHVSKETMLHGSYNDYMREFHKQMQRAYPGFPGPFPPPFMGMQFYPPPFSVPPPNFGAAVPSIPTKEDDIETHAKLVDKFLKNTRHRSDSSASRSDYEDEDEDENVSDDEAADDSLSDGDAFSGSYEVRAGKRSRRSTSRQRSGRTNKKSTHRSSSVDSEDDEDNFIQYSSKSAQRKY